MKYLKTYNESKLGNRLGTIKKYIGTVIPFMKGGWKKYKNEFNIDVTIQPGFKTNSYLETRIDSFLKKIYELSKKYTLVYNSATLYQSGYITSIKFRLGDSSGDNYYGTIGKIPSDIKEEIISDVKKYFGNLMKIDEFEDRGYIIFDINIYLDNNFYT